MRENTCSSFPFLIQFVNSSFKVFSYSLTSNFLITILFLKWVKFSGHRSWEMKTTKFHKNNARKSKDISQLYSSLNVLQCLRLEVVELLLPPCTFYVQELCASSSKVKRQSKQVSRESNQHSGHKEQCEKKRIWGLETQSGKGVPAPTMFGKKKEGTLSETDIKHCF